MYIHIGQIWTQSSIAIPKVNPIQHCLPLLEMKIYASRMFRRYLSVIPGNVPWNIHTLVTFALSRLEVQKFLSAWKIVQLKRVIVPLRGRCDARLEKRSRVQAEQKFRDVSGNNPSNARVSLFCCVAFDFFENQDTRKMFACILFYFRRLNEIFHKENA